MKALIIVVFCAASACRAQSDVPTTRSEAEYYVAAYAKHYRVPIALVRAIVEHKSNWQPCTVSSKGAAGLMQLMPSTAKSLGVTDRCNLEQNVSGGVRYLTWLIERFHHDLRLAVAAYYAGEDRIGRRGLVYRNSDVLAYVSGIRTAYFREARIEGEKQERYREKRCEMNKCLSLVHLITIGLLSSRMAAAQSELPLARIVNLTVDPEQVLVLHLRPGYVSSVRVLEEVSSVVLGDPGTFKAEHSEAEPQLVFFTATTAKPAQTNALITTKGGRELPLSLVSLGKSDPNEMVDYVLNYERPRSFLIASNHSSFVVGDTRSITSADLRADPPVPNAAANREPEVLKPERLENPHWEGKLLRVAVGPTTEKEQQMIVSFAVLNSSSRTIEVLPPQVQLAGISKDKHRKAIKAEPVAIKDYSITTRKLAPGARADGVVLFERPSFKESNERLLLAITQAEEVDRPVLAPIAFVAPVAGGRK
jgi:hypothetical protein